MKDMTWEDRFLLGFAISWAAAVLYLFTEAVIGLAMLIALFLVLGLIGEKTLNHLLEEE